MATTIHIPLAVGLGLLLFFVLFSGATQSDPASAESTFDLPSIEPTYVQASTVATMAPIRNWTIEDPVVSANAALIIDDISGTSRPLYILNGTTTRPLASIVKLLTALTALSSLDPEETITITTEDIATPENAGGLLLNETISVRDLLAALLVESSNDAAHALARVAGNGSIETFVTAMNEFAQTIGLHGLTADDPVGVNKQTQASSLDVARLLQAAIEHPVLAPLLSLRRYDTETHTFVSTHNLFNKLDNITGAKTGFTEEAGQNLVLQRKLPNGRVITSVVLGSLDREADTIALHSWTEQTFYYKYQKDL